VETLHSDRLADGMSTRYVSAGADLSNCAHLRKPPPAFSWISCGVGRQPAPIAISRVNVMSPLQPFFDASMCGSIASATLSAPAPAASEPAVAAPEPFAPPPVEAPQPTPAASRSWRSSLSTIVSVAGALAFSGQHGAVTNI